MRTLFLRLPILLCLMCFEMQGADWKVGGGTSILASEKVIWYFDSAGIEQFPGGKIRVWTKAIKETEFNLILKKKEKQIVKEAVQKLVTYYASPLIKKSSWDDMVSIATSEVIANYPETKVRGMFFYEIDCRKKMIRTLSAILFKDDGTFKESNNNETEWGYISPESNGESLLKILCNAAIRKMK